jgi:hypothetical protein
MNDNLKNKINKVKKSIKRLEKILLMLDKAEVKNKKKYE